MGSTEKNLKKYKNNNLTDKKDISNVPLWWVNVHTRMREVDAAESFREWFFQHSITIYWASKCFQGLSTGDKVANKAVVFSSTLHFSARANVICKVLMCSEERDKEQWEEELYFM